MRIIANERVALVPVLEVEPYRFSRRPLPETCPARAYPEAWNDFFDRCMADAGFAGVRALGAGSSFVEARRLIGNALLDRLIREAVEGSGLPGFPVAEDKPPSTYPAAESISMLAGGLALVVDGNAVLWPSCCGDLGNLRSWQEALTPPRRDGGIWIGHPELGVAFAGDTVTLTEGWDYPPRPDYLVEVTMPAAWLAAAVDGAVTEHARFRAELEAIVARVLAGPDAAGWVADILVGTR